MEIKICAPKNPPESRPTESKPPPPESKPTKKVPISKVSPGITFRILRYHNI